MLVSILIPCYNAERWIAQAVESALAQTWPEKEIIVVDDGSTDKSLEVIKSFGGKIRWETGPNRGGNAARTRLLNLSRGEWLQYLDADDYLLPDKVTGQMEFLAAHPAVDVVYSPIVIQNESNPGARPAPNQYPINTDDVWTGSVRWHMPQTGGFLFKRSSLLDVGGWNPLQPCCQDNEMTMRLLMAGKRFIFCPAIGAVYRLWSSETVSKRNGAEVRARRLEILQKSETYLRGAGQLSEARLWAINQTRLEIARVAWPENQPVALEIVRIIRESQPGFQPGAPIPAIYRRLFGWFGFHQTEILAAFLRKFRRCLGRRRNL